MRKQEKRIISPGTSIAGFYIFPITLMKPKTAKENAQQALDEYLLSNNDTEAIQYSEKIKQHKANINNKNWGEFP